MPNHLFKAIKTIGLEEHPALVFPEDRSYLVCVGD